MVIKMVIKDGYLIAFVRSALVALVHIEYFLSALITPLLDY